MPQTSPNTAANIAVDTAVIVAAGFGSRLGPLTEEIPKGFVPVAGTALIERSVANLYAAGIKTILFGTGWKTEVYEAFAAKHDGMSCVYSDRFADTSSMYTLYNMRSAIDRPFLLLESDLLYEPRALAELIDDPREDIVLGSDATDSGDEVYLEADDEGRLIKATKKRAEVSRVDAELVGISKISLKTYAALCGLMEANLQTNPKQDYEGALAQLGVAQNVYVKRVDGLLWCEVDDARQLDHATDVVMPRIEANQR